MTEPVIAILRRLALPVYLPVIVGRIGLGMLVPVLPLYLAAEAVSLEATSVVLSALGVGAMISGLPAGGFIARASETKAFMAALILLGVSTALLGFTTAAVVLFALRLAAGAANITIRLSRQSYITRRVVQEQRGRAMALVGGSYRVALLVGPLLGGALVDLVGFRWTFLIAGLFALVGLVPVSAVRNPLPVLPGAMRQKHRHGLVAALRSGGRPLLLLGFVQMLVMGVREGRFVVLPLIADELGLSATNVGVVVAVGTGADLMLFPVSGWIMDRFGRLRAVVPAFGLVTIGLVALSTVDTVSGVVIAGVIIGVGNGLGAGTMLTIGSDLAPADSPAPFLAGLATMQDGGRIIGPLVVGFVGAAAGLGASALVLAGIMAAAVLWFVLVVGETAPAGRAPAS